MLGDIAGVLRRPQRRLAEIALGRPLPSAVVVVVGSSGAALGLSLLATFLEPLHSGDSRAAGVGFSVALPVLFTAVWLADAWIIDAVARLMAGAGRRMTYLITSAYAIPVLVVYEAVRVIQALIDRGATDASAQAATTVGFVNFAVLAWFVILLTIAIRVVYGLPTMSALTAAMAPSAVMAALLLLFLVVATALHGAGLI